jgi:hypothetical protein
LGIAIGAISVVLYRRLKQVVEADNPELLVDRLAQQLEELEGRLGSTPKPA